MKNRRLVFDDDFYILGAITLTKKFKLLEERLRVQLASEGLRLPHNGFKTNKEYRLWIKRAMRSSNASKKPGILIGNILKEFNLDPTKETYRNGLVLKIFFNKKFNKDFGPLKNNIDFAWIKDSPLSENLIVKIYPWTKKEDYNSLWPEINKVQKLYQNYRGKEKYQITFKRDFSTYVLFMKTKQEREESLGKKQTVDSVLNHLADKPSYLSLLKRFEGENLDDKIRVIISRFNRLLKGIDIY